MKNIFEHIGKVPIVLFLITCLQQLHIWDLDIIEPSQKVLNGLWLPINEIPYEVFLLEPRKADNYAKVAFDKNLYSSSPKYAQENVYVKASSDKVWILNQFYEVIMEHPRLYGNGLESMKWLPYIVLMSKRPEAMKYTTFYQELPDNWQKYLGKQNTDGKGLTSLYTMLQKHDMGTAEEALTSQMQQLQPMQLRRNVISMPSFTTDNAKYDNLFSGEVSSL